MSDSFLMTTQGSHFAAVLVGVLVTLSMTIIATSRKWGSGAAVDKAAPGNAALAAAAKKKKKRTKKKGGTAQEAATGGTGATNASEAVAVPSTADDSEEEDVAAPPTLPPSQEEPSSSNSAQGKKVKKKKSKATADATTVVASNGSAGKTTSKVETLVDAPAAAPTVSAPSPPWSSADYEPPLPKQKEEAWATISSTKSKKTKAKAPVPAPTNSTTSSARTVVVGKAAPAATPEAAVPVAPEVIPAKPSEIVSIDATKVGIIIGPKGATMQAIQAATGCKLDVNAPAKDGPKTSRVTKATVVITNEGSIHDGIAKARQAILELASRGFATLLQSDSFGESHIQVHPRFLSEIVGPGGRTIQALQSGLSVKITIPKTDWKPNSPQVGNTPPSCKVGIAGDDKANIKQAKLVIQDIIKYHHHEITHPGIIHDEVHVPQEFFPCVIGPRGAEIKHIRGNFKVDVYMPNSDQENALVVGQSENVAKAIGYIQRLMERDSEQRARKYSDELYG